MNNKKIYDRIIENAKSRGLDKKKLEGYFEKHHVIPKCMGGKDEDSNYVLLTAKEHFVCHHLLWKSQLSNMQLFWSFKAMAFWKRKSKSSIPITAKQYQELRKIHSENVKERMTGRVVSEETKEKLRIINTGKKYSDNTKKKLSDFQKTVTHTEEWNEKISKSLKGKSKSLESIEKIRASQTGKRYSDETNAKKASRGSENPAATKCLINNIEFGCLKDAVTYASNKFGFGKKKIMKMFNDETNLAYVRAPHSIGNTNVKC